MNDCKDRLELLINTSIKKINDACDVINKSQNLIANMQKILNDEIRKAYNMGYQKAMNDMNYSSGGGESKESENKLVLKNN